MALITCQNLKLGYESRVVIDDLSFSLNQGDYLCIVGDNGSGKTTLIKSLMNLKAPLSGTISLGDGLRRQEIGYLPQQTVVQKDFPASVSEIVLSGCLNRMGNRPFYSRREKDLASQAMAKMAISDLKRACYRELSGGQQQRVLLARALCASSRLLVLDEPMAGLDPKLSQELYALIKELNSKDKMSIIMISHDVASAVSYASHILHVASPYLFATTKDYLASDLGKQYLGA